jgi:hypothetical protein
MAQLMAFIIQQTSSCLGLVKDRHQISECAQPANGICICSSALLPNKLTKPSTITLPIFNGCVVQIWHAYYDEKL